MSQPHLHIRALVNLEAQVGAHSTNGLDKYMYISSMSRVSVTTIKEQVNLVSTKGIGYHTSAAHIP